MTGRGAAGSLIALSVVASVLSGCGAGASTTGLPPTPPIVDIVMKEFVIQRPAVIPRGRVVFRVHNAGRIEHVLQLLIWPDNLPPVADQAKGRLPAVHADELGGTPLQVPGQTDEFAVDLDPGRYAMIDLEFNPDGQTDAQKGMATEFRIPGPVPAARQSGATTTSTSAPQVTP